MDSGSIRWATAGDGSGIECQCVHAERLDEKDFMKQTGEHAPQRKAPAGLAPARARHGVIATLWLNGEALNAYQDRSAVDWLAVTEVTILKSQ